MTTLSPSRHYNARADPVVWGVNVSMSVVPEGMECTTRHG
jgi:hypothetical protein